MESNSCNNAFALNTFMMTFLCIFPGIIRLSYDRINDSDRTYDIWKAVLSDELSWALVSCASVAFPTMLNLFLKALFNPFELLKGPNFLSLVFVFIIILPNYIIFFYSIPSENLFSLLIILRLRLVLVVTTCLYCIDIRLPALITHRLAVATAFFVSFGRVLALYSVYISPTNSINMNIIELLVNILGLLLLYCVCWLWIIEIRKILKRKTMSQDQFLACTCIVSVLILVTGVTILSFIYPSHKWENFDKGYLVSLIMLYAVVFVVHGVFQGRAVEQEATLCQVTFI